MDVPVFTSRSRGVGVVVGVGVCEGTGGVVAGGVVAGTVGVGVGVGVSDSVGVGVGGGGTIVFVTTNPSVIFPVTAVVYPSTDSSTIV